LRNGVSHKSRTNIYKAFEHLRTEIKELKSVLPGPLSTPTPVPPVSPSKSLKGIEFPLQEANSLKGIIPAEIFMTKELSQLDYIKVCLF
jgi:hypothetical protein